MRLDSYAYRLLYWKHKLFGKELERIPRPVYWRKPSLEYPVPPDLLNKITKTERKNLEAFQEELKIITQIYTYLPSKLEEKDWLKIVKINSTKERFEQLKFYKKVETERGKDEDRRKRRKESVTEEKSNYNGDAEAMVMVHSQKMAEHESRSDSLRLIRAYLLKDRPTIAIDCRYLQDHSMRGLALTFQQLNMLFSRNRQRQEPWRLNFVNFNDKIKAIKESRRHYLDFGSDKKFNGELTDQSYLDLYPKDKIIYLSPHTDNVLQSEEVLDSENVFVIGGIVDRVREPNIHPEASAIAAQQEGVKLRRLPLDENVEWKAGNQLLTLTTVMQILQDTNENNGDWQKGLAINVPRRYLTTAKERTPHVKVKYQSIREHDRAVVRIIHEEINKKKEKAEHEKLDSESRESESRKRASIKKPNGFFSYFGL